MKVLCPRLARRLLALSLAMLVTVLVSGCGGQGSGDSGASEELTPVTLTLDWYPNADHAGIYAAQAQGFFEEKGLEVEIQQPSDPAAVLQLVAAGRSEFGISYENALTSAAVRDVPVESVMAVVQVPLNSVISLEDSGVTEPEDLAGKKVGYAGQSFGSAVIDTIARNAGVDPSSVEKVNVGYDLRPALTSGRVDAVVDAYWNIEAVELAGEGFQTNVMKLPDLGVPTYNELVLATSDSYAEQEPETVRSFVAAMVKGHRYALENPQDTGDALLSANEELDPGVVGETLDLTVPTFKTDGRPAGYQDPEEWRAYISWAVENEVLPEPVEVDQAMTNKFLPGS